MGLASLRNTEAERMGAGLDEVAVIDSFEVKGTRTGHAPGVVAVLDAYPVNDPDELVGRRVRIRRPDGGCRAATVEDARGHGVTISLFFGGLTKADVPVGSCVEIGRATRAPATA